ncbi:hypothetical protein DSO57_1010050 [Entomophthora muscae]|uniref:Uncharacterized protein n=1 Tax=Entomophthora muscae TaxID=34485 RepID=A0ACC2TTX6_9FUNG|nr:hypothetical protein DSO57_1010050 [Entomophthora muscae]
MDPSRPPAPLPTVGCLPGAPYGPIHFTEYPLKPKYKDFTFEKIIEQDCLVQKKKKIPILRFKPHPSSGWQPVSFQAQVRDIFFGEASEPHQHSTFYAQTLLLGKFFCPANEINNQNKVPAIFQAAVNETLPTLP